VPLRALYGNLFGYSRESPAPEISGELSPLGREMERLIERLVEKKLNERVG
jgi:hypothetical protein